MSNLYAGIVPDTEEHPRVKAKRSWRTALQTAVGILVMLPGLLQTPGVLTALPWLVGVVPAAAVIARLMLAPAVQRHLPAWLRTPADQ
ncbi:hypothetical protein [Streptomyces sp. NPDC001999]